MWLQSGVGLQIVGHDVYYTAITGGVGQSFALDSDGKLWAWGYNKDGQLGDGTTTDKFIPTPVKFRDPSLKN